MELAPLIDHFNSVFGLPLLAMAQGRPLMLADDETIVGSVFGLSLHTIFSPRFDRHGFVDAYRADVRAHSPSGRPLTAWTPYDLALDRGSIVEMDRLMRTLHALNATRLPAHLDLVLNVHPRLVVDVAAHHGTTFARILDRIGIAPERVTLRFPGLHHTLPAAADAMKEYRANAFRIALVVDACKADDAHDLLRLAPDRIEVPRHLLEPADEKGGALEVLFAAARGAGAAIDIDCPSQGADWPAAQGLVPDGFYQSIDPPLATPGVCTAAFSLKTS